MAEEYDSITAQHYSAYRPPLHKLILKKCINSKVDLGLDIGCGTGHSTIALSHFCRRVVGIDPSSDMLAAAIEQPQVKYQLFDKRKLEFQDDVFDLITFAGSLYYAKSQELLDEVVRVSKQAAIIVVYDFEIDLDQILTDLGVQPVIDVVSAYNHQENFSGLEQNHLELEIVSNDVVTIKTVTSELAHLLLSSKPNYKFLRKKYGGQKLLEKLIKSLNTISGGAKYDLKSNIYFSVYKCQKY